MLCSAQKVGYWVRNSKFWLFASLAFFFSPWCLHCCDLPLWNEPKNRSSASDQWDGFDWTCPSVPASNYQSAGCLLYGGSLFEKKSKANWNPVARKKRQSVLNYYMEDKNFLNSLKRCELINSVLVEFTPRSRIVLERGHLGTSGKFESSSQQWILDNWVLIPVVISLKYLWLFALPFPKLVTPSLTSPPCSVICTLHKARTQDLLQGIGMEGCCCQDWGWETWQRIAASFPDRAQGQEDNGWTQWS